MAESSGEKTEQPSAKRLRDAREKGDIPKSQEVVSVATVCVVFGYFVGTTEDFYQRFLSVTEAVFTKGTTLPFDRAWQELFPMIIDTMVSFILPLVGCIFVTGVLAFMVQNGVVLAPKAAMPKLENLSPKKWFDNVFSKKNAFDFVMNLIKVGVLSSAVYIAVNNSIRPILSVNKSDIYGVLSLTGILIVDLFINVLVAFIVIAVFDWFYTRMTYTKKHMMTKEEVKKEYKEQEGDPIIKSKRKQLHQEMQNQSKLDKTRKAKVLIVNPTHYAVALFYDKKEAPLPYMLAKGEGDLARRMIEVAKQENIPIMRNPPLARALYADANEDEFIPADMLMQVAEILRIVMSMSEQDQ